MFLHHSLDYGVTAEGLGNTNQTVKDLKSSCVVVVSMLQANGCLGTGAVFSFPLPGPTPHLTLHPVSAIIRVQFLPLRSCLALVCPKGPGEQPDQEKATREGRPNQVGDNPTGV